MNEKNTVASSTIADGFCLENLMKRFLCATFATLGIVSAGTAFAAVNTDAVHLALNSLLLASSKMSVVNAMNRTGKAPANNAEARLGSPNTMTTNEISSIVVTTGGVLNVYLSAVAGTNHGVVRFTPAVSTDPKGGKSVAFTCTSPNIPEIATLQSGCSYAAGQ